MKSLRNPNRRPTHPGAVLREDVVPALKITQGEFAKLLGVSRVTGRYANDGAYGGLCDAPRDVGKRGTFTRRVVDWGSTQRPARFAAVKRLPARMTAAAVYQ
jgi:hypothetical protein